MTAVEQRDLTEDEARAFVHHVRASVEEIGNWIVRAVKGRAWLALGYPSWDAMCEAEFDGAVIRLPREDRREAVASLREAGLSIPAIASGLGVSVGTVHGDLSEVKGPERIVGLDGRERPATQPTTKTATVVDADTGEISEVEYEDPAAAIARNRRFTAERYVEEFPELQYYLDLDRIADVVRLGDALRGYVEPERTMRRTNLRKAIAAEQRRAEQPAEPAGPDWAQLAADIFYAANEAAKVIARKGGPQAIEQALAVGQDQITIDNWHGQFTELADACAQLAEACAPKKLRRIK